jgi:hypothetical protein
MNMQKVFPIYMSLYSLEILDHFLRIIFFTYAVLSLGTQLTGEISDGNKSKPYFTNFFLEAVSYACWKLINRWHVWYWIGCHRITPLISNFCNSMLMSISLHQINTFVTNFWMIYWEFLFSVVSVYFKVIFVIALNCEIATKIPRTLSCVADTTLYRSHAKLILVEQNI